MSTNASDVLTKRLELGPSIPSWLDWALIQTRHHVFVPAVGQDTVANRREDSWAVTWALIVLRRIALLNSKAISIIFSGQHICLGIESWLLCFVAPKNDYLVPRVSWAKRELLYLNKLWKFYGSPSLILCWPRHLQILNARSLIISFALAEQHINFVAYCAATVLFACDNQIWQSLPPFTSR